MMFKNAAELIYEFPWLAPRDDWDEPMEFYKESEAWTEVDGLPEGWKEGFLEDMLYEIDEVIKEYDCEDTYRVTSAFDYMGVITWSHTGFPASARPALTKIIDNYKKVCTETCMICGRFGKMYQANGQFVVRCDLHKPDEEDLDVLL